MKTIPSLYICETCGFESHSRRDIFDCTRCHKKEICSNCQYDQGFCSQCSNEYHNSGLNVKQFVMEYFG